jgi:hypothetical protein
MNERKKANPGLSVQSWPAVVDGLSRQLVLIQGPYAARAKLHTLGTAIRVDGDLLNIRLPLAFGAHVGVAHVVSK